MWLNNGIWSACSSHCHCMLCACMYHATMDWFENFAELHHNNRKFSTNRRPGIFKIVIKQNQILNFRHNFKSKFMKLPNKNQLKKRSHNYRKIIRRSRVAHQNNPWLLKHMDRCIYGRHWIELNAVNLYFV